jgi:chromosome segregation ATPase
VPAALFEEENMNPPKTTARPSVDLDATDELPVLDPAAYEAEILSREAAVPSDSSAEPDPSAAGSSAPEHRIPNAVPPVADSEAILAVESWIVQKTEELRAHHDALSLAQRERIAAVARAGALSRELAEKSANLEALTEEQEAALRRAAELDAARRETVQLAQQLVEARAAELQRNAELATRLRDGEARERNAQHTIEVQNQTHAELTRRVQQETSARERLAAEVNALQAQLANCLESLHSRESYRAIYESSLQELDAELAAARLRAAEQEARANQLGAELQSREQRLQEAAREHDATRHLRNTEVAQHAAERGEGERTRGALESRLAELTAAHADAGARLLATQATLAAAQQRAEAEAIASAASAERLRELESATASRQAELTSARLEIERNRALLADLTAALLKSQTMFSDQGRLLEERESAASAMAASHAEQTALMAKLRAQTEELTARLAAPDAERRALEARLAALTKEAVENDSRLSRLESMNSELRATVGQLDTLLAERDAELQRATQMASMNAYALGRVQSSIDELGRSLTASEGASSQPQASILTRIDNGQNHSVVLRGRTTIGRDRDNDLSLAMRSVSRHHAVLIPGFRTAFIQDLKSTNGVLVNQRRVRCARLEHGDMVNIGEAQFRFTVAPAPAGTQSAASTASSSTRTALKHAP